MAHLTTSTKSLWMSPCLTQRQSWRWNQSGELHRQLKREWEKEKERVAKGDSLGDNEQSLLLLLLLSLAPWASAHLSAVYLSEVVERQDKSTRVRSQYTRYIRLQSLAFEHLSIAVPAPTAVLVSADVAGSLTVAGPSIRASASWQRHLHSNCQSAAFECYRARGLWQNQLHAIWTRGAGTIDSALTHGRHTRTPQTKSTFTKGACIIY